jgi:hypothetical protein
LPAFFSSSFTRFRVSKYYERIGFHSGFVAPFRRKKMIDQPCA